MPVTNEIIFTAQTQSSTSAIEAFNNAIRASGKIIGEFTNETVKLNAAGDVTVGTINQMSASGQKLTATFKMVGGAAQVMGATAKEAGEEGAKGGAAFGVSWQGLVRIMEVQLFRRGITAIVNALRDGIQSAIQYQIQLQQVANVTGQGGARLDNFAARVRSLSEQFGIGIFEGLGAAQIAITGQVGDAAKGFDVLTASMRLSQATGTEVAASTRLVTTSLEAFHLEANQASRIADVFFTTAQRSRVPLEETQAAIGRVSQTANALGISFEQMNALFLTVAQQGGRPTEAFSLLNQVMGRLIQPTQKLQEFLNGLGTPTAAIAIQTFGLTGFLQKLNETAAQSPDRLGDLAGSVRTLRGLMALTGESTARFQENLRALGEGGGGLAAAVAAVQQTPAQKLQDEFQKLKNIFSQDIGQTFIRSVVGISNALGGAQATVRGFVSAVTSLAIAFGAYKIATSGATFVTETWIAIARSGSAGARGFAASMTVFTNSLTAAYIAGSLFFEMLNQIERARSSDLRAAADAVAREGEAQIQRTREASARRTDQDRQLVGRAYAGRLERDAAAVRSANNLRDIEINNQRAVSDSIRTTSATFLDALRNKVSLARDAVRQAENAIKASARSAGDFARQLESSGFQRRLAAEQDPDAAIRILQERIQSRQAQATAIFQNPRASQDEIARARAMFGEINHMQEEMADRERAITRARDEQTGQWREQIINGRTVLVFQASFRLEDERRNRLIEDRNRLEETYRANQERILAEETKRLANAQLRLRVFDALLKRATDFSVLTAQGEFIPEFQREEERQPGGGEAAAVAALRKLQAEIRAAQAAQGGDISILMPLFREQDAALERQLVARRRVNAETERQANTLRLIREDTAVLGQLERQRTANLENFQQTATNIGRQLASSAAFARTGRTAIPAIDQIDVLTAGGGNQALLRETRRAFNEYRQAAVEAQEAQRLFNLEGGQTPQRLNALQQALQRTQTAGRGLQTILERPGVDEVAWARVLSTLRLQGIGEDGQFLERLRRSLSPEGGGGLQGALRAIGELRENMPNDQIDQLRQRLEEAARADPARAMGDNLERIPGLANNAQQAMTQALDRATTSATNLNNQMSGVVGNFRQLGQLPGGQAAMGGLAGGVGFMAGGGTAGFFPGAPKGTDILPYWLTPGEFIMPVEQTKQFYTQLLAMRSGHQPKYAATGGAVTVGDIHLHLSGSGPTEKTIRDIGRGLDREIRRGTIRLGRPS